MEVLTVGRPERKAAAVSSNGSSRGKLVPGIGVSSSGTPLMASSTFRESCDRLISFWDDPEDTNKGSFSGGLAACPRFFSSSNSFSNIGVLGIFTINKGGDFVGMDIGEL